MTPRLRRTPTTLPGDPPADRSMRGRAGYRDDDWDGEDSEGPDGGQPWWLLDPLGMARVAWGRDDASGVYYAPIGNSEAIALCPDPDGSGLYVALVLTLHGPTYAQSVTPTPLPLRDAVGCAVIMLAVESLLPTLTKQTAYWRDERPTIALLGYLAELDREQALRAKAECWSRGKVSLAVTGALVLPRLAMAKLSGVSR